MSLTMFKNRHLLVLSILLLLVAGISALFTLPRLEDPRITLRNPTVLTFFPGASAERVEAIVSKPLEVRLREMHEIKTIESTSRAGVSVLAIELQDWVNKSNNQQIFSQIRDKLDSEARNFPPQVSKPVFDDKRGASAFTLLIALSAKQDTDTALPLVNRLAEELGDRMRNIGGTDIVRLYGQPEEEIQVRLDPIELASLGITIQHIADLISRSDSKAAAGALRTTERDVFMEVNGALDSVQRLANIPISANNNDGLLFLGDIAKISKTQVNPPTEIAFTQGQQSIFVAVRMTDTLRVDQWTTQAKSALQAFDEQYGAGLNIDILFEQNEYTEQRLAELATNLGLGVIVVMLVVLIFMGWKPSLIVGLSLPLSMSGALFSLSFFGEQIHQMSIFGMIIAIGLLIDNAIVMMDEVRKNVHERGLSSKAALLKAVNHLRAPLLASTLTTILGFMPIFLLPGNVGDFVGPIAIAVVMALVFSFIISITIIATLAAIFAKPTQARNKPRWWRSGIKNTVLANLYRKSLTRILKIPSIGVAIALTLPISGFVLAGSLSNVFFPSADRDHFQVEVWLEESASVYASAQKAKDIDDWIRQQDGVTRTHWLAGGSTPSVYYNQIMNKDGLSSYAQGVVFAKDVETANQLIERFQDQLDQQFPDSQIVVRAFGQGPPIAAPVSFRLVGPSTSELRLLGEEIRLALSKHPGVTHSQASVTGANPKLWINLDEDKVRLAGLSLTEVANQFQAQLEGTTSGTILEDVEELPIRVKLANDKQSNLELIESFNIISPTTQDWIPLSSLGELSLKPEIAAITRRNGERVNTILAYLYPGIPAIDVSNAVVASLEEQGFTLPNGYSLQIAGDANEQQNAVGLLLTYIPVLLTLMVATLILSFRSGVLAGIIGLVAALSAGLGMLSLWISGFPIGFNPLLGTAGLIGVAINGSIVVLAAIRANADAAGGNIQAIVQETMGCSRHILSTTFTTVAGFMPLLLSGGTFWPPLAVVIAGGVGFSITLSLLFTPAAYSLLYKRKMTTAPIQTL